MDSSFFQEIRFLISDLFLTFERLFCYESFFSKYGQFVAGVQDFLRVYGCRGDSARKLILEANHTDGMNLILHL